MKHLLQTSLALGCHLLTDDGLLQKPYPGEQITSGVLSGVYNRAKRLDGMHRCHPNIDHTRISKRTFYYVVHRKPI